MDAKTTLCDHRQKAAETGSRASAKMTIGCGRPATPRAEARRRHHDEQGVALVEFAIILPLLFLLIFAIVDFGTTFNDYQSVRQGGRDAIRTAIVNTTPKTDLPHCSSSSATGDISDIHMASRPPQGSAAADLVCYAKARVGLDPAKTRVKIVFTPGPTAAIPFLAGNPVLFCVQYPVSSTSGLLAPFLNNKVASTKVETLIELNGTDSSLNSGWGSGSPVGTIQEDPVTPPSGNTWSSACSAALL
jgi:Flp pilus assembly protein TadG